MAEAARHRRTPARGGRRTIALVAILAAMLLPAASTLAAPGTAPDPQASQGPQAGADKPGKGADPEPEVWTGVPGTNLAHDSYGYPWPAAPDCDESNVSSGGCVNDGVGFFQGQCTSWVAYRLGQRNGVAFSNWFEGRHWGNASEWAKVGKKLGYKPNKVPAVGAVGWYARGHVSYVEDVNSDGSVVISEMNTDGHNGFHLVTVRPGDSSWPDRFLHLADIVPVDFTAPDAPEPVTETSSSDVVDLSWKAPADDIGVTGYRVLRNGVEVATTQAPSYTDRQASPGQAYTYSVVASDAAGNASRPGTVVLPQDSPAPRRWARKFRAGSTGVLSTGAGPVICGRLGSPRDQRIGCEVRTLEGWSLVRAGRHVPWGLRDTRAFVPGDDGRVWFCRVLPGTTTANACLPLDLVTRSWGFDRVDARGDQPAYATWVASATGPARCGTVGDRAVCAALVEKGWRTRSTHGSRAGDPLSRAFVPTADGVGFCRNVAGRASCAELDLARLRWGKDVTTGRGLPHGRWMERKAGTALCLDKGGCRLVTGRKG